MSKFILFFQLALAMPALAGPQLAVFCDGFTAFDIAPSEQVLRMEGKLRIGDQTFEIKVDTGTPYNIETQVHQVTDSTATTSYARKEGGDRIALQVKNAAGELKDLGKIHTVIYQTLSPAILSTETRVGSVTVKLLGSDIETLKFKNCKYSGGSLKSWKKMWGRE